MNKFIKIEDGINNLKIERIQKTTNLSFNSIELKVEVIKSANGVTKLKKIKLYDKLECKEIELTQANEDYLEGTYQSEDTFLAIKPKSIKQTFLNDYKINFNLIDDALEGNIEANSNEIIIEIVKTMISIIKENVLE